MTAILDEHKNWQDDGGKPIVNGKVYFGVRNENAKLNPITIFSDAGLDTPAANPQTTDSLGQTDDKIYVTDFYSILVEDSALNTIYSEEDNGTGTDLGAPISLDNVQGANDLTAEGTPVITEYTPKQIYLLKTVLENTGAMTLDAGAGPVPIKIAGIPIVSALFAVNTTIELTFNSTGPIFEVISGNNLAVKNALQFATLKGEEATDSAEITRFDDGDIDEGSATRGVTQNAVKTFSALQGLRSLQAIPGSGTWNRPTGINKILVICTGSGGGGGGSSTNKAASGGGAGATVFKVITAPNASYLVVIGAAGAGGAGTGDTAGLDGADSTFGGTLVVASKGLGAPNTQVGGAGGKTGTGDYVVPGADGNDVGDALDQLGGAGASTYWGGGGARKRASTGGAGVAFGTGGAGGPSGGNFGGGPGKTGVVLVLEFA